jgi:glycosyltransferase involved in cell wall biosynthesis
LLIILTTHPIQYQVPVWQALARDGRVPFEVWYMSGHGLEPSRDREFGKTFAWDIDLTRGYPHRFLAGAERSSPGSFRGCRLHEPLAERLREAGATALWINGWQVAAYWQAVRQARDAGCEVWLRGESNGLGPVAWWKRPIKRAALGLLFSRVDRFLAIGEANARLYHQYGVPDSRLYPAPYAADNERFASQAEALRPQRAALRRQWGIADDAFCVMFCGKFIAKKRPLDLVRAAELLARQAPLTKLHLLFVGAGQLGEALRAACDVACDADAISPATRPGKVKASFAGFLNQTEISRAYVAADCLVLPSDTGETWGVVVNEALASGLPAIVSDACGSAEDLAAAACARFVYPCGDVAALAQAITTLKAQPLPDEYRQRFVAAHDIQRTLDTVIELGDARAQPRKATAS